LGDCTLVSKTLPILHECWLAFCPSKSPDNDYMLPNYTVTAVRSHFSQVLNPAPHVLVDVVLLHDLGDAHQRNESADNENLIFDTNNAVEDADGVHWTKLLPLLSIKVESLNGFDRIGPISPPDHEQFAIIKIPPAGITGMWLRRKLIPLVGDEIVDDRLVAAFLVRSTQTIDLVVHHLDVRTHDADGKSWEWFPLVGRYVVAIDSVQWLLACRDPAHYDELVVVDDAAIVTRRSPGGREIGKTIPLATLKVEEFSSSDRLTLLVTAPWRGQREKGRGQ